MTRNVSANVDNVQKRPESRVGSAYIKTLPLFLALIFFFSGCTGTTQQATHPSGNLTITGSTALEPLVQVAAQAYMQENPDAHIKVSGGGSKTGLQDVTSGKATIGDSDIYADPALYPNPDLTDHIVCVTRFALIVNPDVTISSLTRQQIIDIYSTGKYKNWSELGGPDISIATIVRPSSSGTRDTFRKYILDGRDEIGTYTLSVDDTQKVVNMVATTPGAIGYAAFASLNTHVKVLSIDGQQPTTAAISSGRYDFWSYEHMYTIGENNVLASDFLNFMNSATVIQRERKLNYIPSSDLLTGAIQQNNPDPAIAQQQESEATRHES